jgi:hypothetical protein
MMPPAAGRPLAGYAERERLLRVLREHYARGGLELEDLSRRVGLVLAAQYLDQAEAALSGLPLLAGYSGGTGPSGPGRLRRWRRGHAQAAAPRPGWLPTEERFRDPTTRVIMRVWIDPDDLSRHYVPETGS